MKFDFNTLHIIIKCNMKGRFLLFWVLFLLTGVLSAQDSKTFVDKRPVKSLVKLDKRDRMDMAIAQEFEMTKDPSTNLVPREKLKDAKDIALEKRKSIGSFVNQNYKSSIQGIIWKEKGPTNVGGRTRCLLLDASDPTNNTLFAGSVAGGLWKTTNSKDELPTWSRIDDFLDNIAISSIVQDPLEPSILYMSTGEGYYNIDAVQGNGIYKSMDGGIHWQQLASTNNPDFYYTQRLAITQNGYLYAATRNGGLQRSIDGGITFEKILGSGKSAFFDVISDIEISADESIYVSVGLSKTDGIYKSTDLGDSWVKLEFGLPIGGYSRIELAAAPSNPAYIYAVFNETETGNCLGIFRSTDAGGHWIEIDNPNMIGNANFLRKQGWYSLAITVDPLNESRILLGGIDVFMSENAGLSFTQITQWYGAQSLPEIHADQHVFVFPQNDNNTVFVGNDGGVYRLTGLNSGNLTENSINSGYNVAQFYSADMHPEANSHIFAAGAQDNGTQLFNGPGLQTSQEITGGDGGVVHFDKDNGNLIITSYVYNNFRVSDDMGNDFTYRSFGNSGRFINPHDYDNSRKVIYSAHNAGALLRWNDPSLLGDSIDVIKIPELNSDVISAIQV